MRASDIRGRAGRRGLLAGAAALVAGGLARLAGPPPAQAEHSANDGLLHFSGSTNTPSVRAYSQLFGIGDRNHVIGVDGSPVSATAAAYGLYGGMGSGRGAGVFGSAANSGNQAAGVYGFADPSSFNVHPIRPSAVGVHGLSVSATGVRGESTSGTGIYGQSNSGLGAVGSSGGNIGVYGASSNNVGVFGDANVNTAVMGRTQTGIGVYGTASNPGGGGRAAVFDGTVLVNGPFTVVGGPKSAGVKLPDGSTGRVYCQESPEPYFEDFGKGQLISGKAEIRLDAGFAAITKADDYLVFPVPEGDCKGLYVSQKGPTRFVVEELQGGTSTLPFSYRVVARRRDEVGKRLEKVDVRPAQSKDVKPPDGSVLEPPARSER